MLQKAYLNGLVFGIWKWITTKHTNENHGVLNKCFGYGVGPLLQYPHKADRKYSEAVRCF